MNAPSVADLGDLARLGPKDIAGEVAFLAR